MLLLMNTHNIWFHERKLLDTPLYLCRAGISVDYLCYCQNNNFSGVLTIKKYYLHEALLKKISLLRPFLGKTAYILY